MEKSTSISNLAKALIAFHVKVDTIKKDSNNPFFNKKYASLSNILDAINFPLIESGLAFTQFPSGENELTTILMHAESGEFIQAGYTMQPVKNDPQGKGSVITYQRRYALSAVLGLNIDEDDDGNAASQTGKSNNREAPPKSPAQELPWLNENTETFLAAINKLKAGKTTIEKIKVAYRLSAAIETKLRDAVKA